MRIVLSLIITVLTIFFSYWIAIPWIEEITTVFGSFLTWFILIGMVFIPCFGMFYITTSLLFSDKEINQPKNYPPISILVAAYNEEKTIRSTIQSIIQQEYPSNVEIIVSDDGSKDNTYLEAKKENCKVIRTVLNKGKSAALNRALKESKHDVIITVDADTILHKDALKNIVKKFMSKNYDAVAGAVRVNNTKHNIMTRMQYWDYILGIASVKLAQSKYDSTLVAQGAFSCYRKEVCNWTDTVGEDIVMSWDILKKEGKIGHANNAIVFTNTPTKYSQFFKQRCRWSRGLVEAFKRDYKLLYKRGKFLPFVWYNLVFPYIDLSYLLFFFPSVIAALVFQNYLMAGMLTLLLLPLSLCLGYVIFFIQNRVNKEQGLEFEKDIIGFVMFILFYQLIQTPATLYGYYKEIFGLQKSWGTK